MKHITLTTNALNLMTTTNAHAHTLMTRHDLTTSQTNVGSHISHGFHNADNIDLTTIHDRNDHITSIPYHNAVTTTTHNLTTTNGVTLARPDAHDDRTFTLPKVDYKKFSHETHYANIDDVFSHNVCEAIARYGLYKLACKGNMTALDILTGKSNNVVTIDDLTQEVAIAMIECDTEGILFDYTDVVYGVHEYNFNQELYALNFKDPDVCKRVFGACTNYMYKHQQKVAYKAYAIAYTDDGDPLTLAIDNALAWSQITNIDDFLSTQEVKTILKAVADKYGKNNIHGEYLALRIYGYTMKECANILETSIQNIRTINKHIKNVYFEIYPSQTHDAQIKHQKEYERIRKAKRREAKKADK